MLQHTPSSSIADFPLRLGAVAVKRHQNGPVGLVVQNDLETGDTRPECWPEEFDRPASSGPRFKPSLPKIGFLERPDLSKW
jgi:hypothetical protein